MRLVSIGCVQMKSDLIRSIQMIQDQIIWDWIRLEQIRLDMIKSLLVESIEII